MSRKINEATSTDLPVIHKLVNDYGWKVGDTLLYQQHILDDQVFKVSSILTLMV